MLLLFATPVTSPFFPFSRLDRLAQVAVVLIKSCATCLELSPKVFVSNPIIDLLPFARSLTLRPRKGPARIGQRSSYIVRSAAAARNGSDPCQILPGLPVATFENARDRWVNASQENRERWLSRIPALVQPRDSSGTKLGTLFLRRLSA